MRIGNKEQIAKALEIMTKLNNLKDADTNTDLNIAYIAKLLAGATVFETGERLSLDASIERKDRYEAQLDRIISSYNL